MSAPLVFVRDGRTLPFVPITTAALDALSTIPRRRRAYARSLYLALLELANEARGDRADVSRRTLGERAGCSRDLVSDLAPLLMEAGVVEVRERFHDNARMENEWVVVEPPAAPDTGCEAGPPVAASLDPRGCEPPPPRLAASTPMAASHSELKKNEEEQRRTTACSARAREEGGEVSDSPLSLLPSDSSNGAGREAEPKKVDDQLVSAEEHDAARRVLDAFNATFATKFAAPDWRAKIIRRLREHADLDVAAHEAAITQNAQNPWWAGAASPSVIYGSAEQFERSLHVEPRKRGRGFKHEQNVPSFDERVRRRNEQREREAAAK
jgi:hypothetical protein